MEDAAATNVQAEAESDDVIVDEELLAAQPRDLGIKDGSSNT